MNILYQDNYICAIDKPAGHFVHPPEKSDYPVPPERISLYHVRDHLRRQVFPVHRLDAPTSGIVVFALSREAAGQLGKLFMQRAVQKTYQAVVRGHLPEQGKIQIPLESNGPVPLVEAETEYTCLAQVELAAAVGKKYPTARYSLMQVHPVTGRWHQIRRHFDRIAHPLLGDNEHGDSHHNRFFRDDLGISGLCLRATHLEFQPPWHRDLIKITATPCEKWKKIHSLFKYSSYV